MSKIDSNMGWLTLPQAAELLPRRRRGRKVAASTLYRWARHGVCGVRLRVWQIGGGGVCTTHAALREFFDELTAAKGLAQPHRREPEDTRIDARLQAKGLVDRERDVRRAKT